MIQKQRDGRNSARGAMGVYANVAALRAMAAVEQVHLVVVTTNSGPTVCNPEQLAKHPQLGKPSPNQPPDRVAVYPPSGKYIVHFKSWANDVVPVLLRHASGSAKRRDPQYRVILHNGEPAGSLYGHFDGTHSRD